MKQSLIDKTTRHQVFVQRYAGHRAKEAVRALNRLRRDTMARLQQGNTEFQRSRLVEMLADIDETLRIGFETIAGGVKQEVGNFASSEVNTAREIIKGSTGINLVRPSDAALMASVEGSVIGAAGVTIEDAFRKLSVAKRKQIAQLITDGVSLGDTSAVIVEKVGALMSTLVKRQVETIVRTTTNHLSSLARGALYEANADVIDGYEWVATLDGRTTLICGSRDGQVYEVGIGPMPPAHWGCRSTTVPHISNAANVGKRPSVFGQVAASTTYGEWLKRQPTSFIDEALGVERSRLFRSGALGIEKFVDPTGRVYTLEQLWSMHPFVMQE